MAKGDWGSDRAFAIRDELASLPEARQAELYLDLVGCLLVEATMLLGREHVALELYGIADHIIGESRFARHGATRS